ncbi:hypothetical protein BDR05DRAFT_961097 [Suillus weaverae]|nr:hypothetical protein BDR05DRAFT_961097 [Suillus weaverae]
MDMDTPLYDLMISFSRNLIGGSWCLFNYIFFFHVPPARTWVLTRICTLSVYYEGTTLIVRVFLLVCLVPGG